MKSIGRIRINNHEKGYLIHGQPFSLQFEFNQASWVLAFYRPGVMLKNHNKTRIATPGSSIFGTAAGLTKFVHFLKRNGEIGLISNAYFPQIEFYIFTSFINPIPRKFKLALNVNFVNARELNLMNSIIPRINPLEFKSECFCEEIVINHPMVEILQMASLDRIANIEPPQLKSFYSSN
jgi:hypothetical protein